MPWMGLSTNNDSSYSSNNNNNSNSGNISCQSKPLPFQRVSALPTRLRGLGFRGLNNYQYHIGLCRVILVIIFRPLDYVVATLPLFKCCEAP